MRSFTWVNVAAVTSSPYFAACDVLTWLERGRSARSPATGDAASSFTRLRLHRTAIRTYAEELGPDDNEAMSATTELRETIKPTPLVRTKLQPPPRREQTIARERLLERLRATPGIKLTVLAAPAGCGKTTLLGTWRELQSEARPIAWLSLDEGDNDPVVLWPYVLEALRGVCPSLQVSSSPRLLGAARTVDTFLPELINALSAVGDAALVLDDFHRLSDGAARESLTWFIGRVPPTFQLVLATRNEPALSLAALRAHGELVELRAADLGFTPSEAEALLNDRLDLGIEPDDVADLVRRTEGWAAGLYLAGLSLQAVEDRHAFVARFGGRSRYVVDFLVDEALEAHDAETQDLMLRASILDRLCGRLCDAVLEREGCGRLLDSLSRANLFLVPLDDRGEWYRFHHLFGQLLRVELEHREPGLAKRLHLRAYVWHRDNGSVEAAIEHALEAGAFAEAGELIVAAWMDYANAGRHATVLAWLERFPEAPLREDPRLLLVQAWVLSLCGRREAAAEAIAMIEQAGPLDAGPLPDGFSSVEASLATLRGTITWGDTSAGLENARRAVELEGPASFGRPVACCALGTGLYYAGDFDVADRWLAEAAGLAPLRGQRRIAVWARAVRSLVAGEQGRTKERGILADEAVRLTREYGLDEVEGDGFVALGAWHAAQGRPGEALPLLERGVAALKLAGHPPALAHGLIYLATALQAVGRREAAAEAIAAASAAVDSCPDPGILGERLAALERRPRERRRSPGGKLSERELLILRMLGGWESEREIGHELYLSHNTIHSHTRSIYRKLGVSSRAGALDRARELGLI
jgi:LuxR family maltose regulon positive regulatory protein